MGAVMHATYSLVLLPVVALTAYYLGGEMVLLAALFGTPLLVFIIVLIVPGVVLRNSSREDLIGLSARDDLIDMLDTVLEDSAETGRKTLCLVIDLDDILTLSERFGRNVLHKCLMRIAERMRGTLRDEDVITKLDGNCFAVAMAPVRHLDLEVAIQIAKRLQSAIEEPLSLDVITVHPSASIGFAMPSRVDDATGEKLLDAAECAVMEAQQNKPSAIRSYVPEMRRRMETRNALVDEISIALENGEIIPWFQPQINAATGKISGFEALARWIHPERGLIQPGDFLLELEQAGLMERLGEVILYHSLAALRSWDSTSFEVPRVGVNFSSAELRNPKLVDKLKWQLDRFELSPDRLSVEVLETVMARSDDDIITRNISAMSDLGCGIDLDDFGTGNASISNVRRFAVERIKIDRSFVTKLDEDQEQQRMVSAILTMAQRLGLDTLAEGVETVTEHAMLVDMGCGHVQGFGIARPMPIEETALWMRQYNARVQPAEAQNRFRNVI
ncbi:GGDEF domain-containing protein [Sulfitobacter sp. 1151]|uniref:GGDEF domain-containing protein n=2 Tax=Parasulfitobacter algicola TaxID=2614809 RepID=A0ABX2IUW4_9RHOB|nr:GGDEF domain-containing protein [Sulfitobacter algicola]